METLTTNGIKISVETFYQDDYSKPVSSDFVFAYRVTIENTSSYTVQLLRRHWYIWDSNHTTREVKGDGVIGKQPTLAPGEQHQYISWSPLKTTIGKMHGTYTMKRLTDNALFKVRIPEFKLVSPFQLN